MAGSSFPLRFQGRTAFGRDACGPLRLTLIGETHDRPAELVRLAFTAAAPTELPDEVQDVCVEQLSAHSYRISSGPQHWTVEGIAHLHREVASRFYEAVPGRPVPWKKRLMWRALLALCGNRLTCWGLLRARG